MDDLDRFERDLVRRVQRGEQKSAREGVQFAKTRSQGPLTYSDLRKRDHPFAVRHGTPTAEPAVINRHSGVFERSWRLKPQPSGAAPVIENIASYAPYLEHGTQSMFRRPIDQSIQAFLTRVRPRNIESELSKLEPPQ
jgi:hypothetical protein